MGQQVAEAGSSTYIHVDNTNDAQQKLNDEVAKLQSGETNSVIFSEYNEQFQAFGLILIFLLIFEICVLESRNPMMKNVRLFKKKK